MTTPDRLPGPHDWYVQEEYYYTLPNGTVEKWLRWHCKRCNQEMKTAKAGYVRPPPNGCVPLAQDEGVLLGKRGRPGTAVQLCPSSEHGAMEFVPPTETENDILTTRYKCGAPGCPETKVVQVPLK
jgi:hypothetical protein